MEKTKLLNKEEKFIRNWFGNRGYPLDDEKIKFKIVEAGGKSWVFLLDRECNDVELYSLESMYREPIDGWHAKGFSWNKKNLINLASYFAPKEPPPHEYCLLATSGDCSAGAMGDNNWKYDCNEKLRKKLEDFDADD
jgi:hypothetical protein